MSKSFLRRKNLVRLVATAAIAGFMSTATGQTWTSTGSGNWSDGTRWDGGVSPTSSVSTVLPFNRPSSANTAYTATNDFTEPFDLFALRLNNQRTDPITIAGGTLRFSGVAGSAIQQDVAGVGQFITPRGAVVISSTLDIAAPLGLSIQSDSGTGRQGDLTLAGQVTGSRITINSSRFALNLTGGTGTGSIGELRNDLSLVRIQGPQTFNLGLTRVGFGNSGLFPELAISGGATVNGTDQLQVGVLDNGSGLLTVAGNGTTLNQLTTAFLGFQGRGSIFVSSSAVANFRDAVFGSDRVGNLLASSGANVTFLDGVTLGLNQGSSGLINISSGASVSIAMTATNNLVVGRAGSGRLEISSGGSLTVGNTANLGTNDNELILGSLETGDGTAVVTGTGSNMRATNLVVGEAGFGSVRILDGGSVTVAGITSLGYSATGSGSIDVIGTNSRLTTAELQVGREGTLSQVFVDEGGTVDVISASGNRGAVFVGALSGSSNAAVVVSRDSTLTAAQVQIGGVGLVSGGDGRLNVFGGGFVHASSVVTVFNNGFLSVDNDASRLDIGQRGGVDGALNVNSGGQLAGTGLVSADVRVGAGGALLPGLNSAGTLAINGNLFMQSSDPLSRSIYGWDLSEAGLASDLLGGSSLSAVHDRIVLRGGNILLDNAQLVLNELAGFGDSFDPMRSYSWRVMEINGNGNISLLNSTTLSFSGSMAIQNAINSNLGSLSFGIGNAGGSNQFLALSYSAVPEPSSVGMCVLMASAGLMRRRRSMR